MLMYVSGIIVFLGVHSLSIINEPWRNRIVGVIGEWPWKGIYSLAAIAGLVMLIQGYQTVRYDSIVLYSPPQWLHYVAAILLLPVFPLVVAAYFPGRIKTITSHPMLLATKFWAFSHLLVTGSLADVLLFASFLAWAVWDRISLNRRKQRPILGAPPSRLNDAIAVAAGLSLYGAFALWFHEMLIGVAPH
jgi:uncharacterized membrane protein